MYEDDWVIKQLVYLVQNNCYTYACMSVKIHILYALEYCFACIGPDLCMLVVSIKLLQFSIVAQQKC